MKAHLLSALAIGLFAMPALAQDPATADPAIDTNGDGAYSFPELLVSMPDLTDESFAALDTSGDGLLDMGEVAAAMAAGLMPASDG